jgi:hypothetical protein
MVRTKPEHIRIEYVQIPLDFVKLHKYVTLKWLALFGNLFVRDKSCNN